MSVRNGFALVLLLFVCFLWSPTFVFAKDVATCGDFDVSEWRGWSEALERQEAAYDDIGTSEDAWLSGVWSDITYGTVYSDLTINGQVYTTEEIHRMLENERKELANAFLEQYTKDGETALENLNQHRAARDEFLQDPDNKEYAQYDTWTGEVRDYEGGVQGYWEEMAHRDSRSFNPIAASFYHDVSEFVRSRQLDEVLTSTDAYIAVMSFPCDAFEV